MENPKRRAFIVSFDIHTQSLSVSERCKFFEGLYGRQQVIKRQNKVYAYRRTGLLDMVEHIRIANSAFIVMEQHMKEIEKFFEEWEKKVDVQTIPVILEGEGEEKQRRNRGEVIL